MLLNTIGCALYGIDRNCFTAYKERLDAEQVARNLAAA